MGIRQFPACGRTAGVVVRLLIASSGGGKCWRCIGGGVWAQICPEPLQFLDSVRAASSRVMCGVGTCSSRCTPLWEWLSSCSRDSSPGGSVHPPPSRGWEDTKSLIISNRTVHLFFSACGEDGKIHFCRMVDGSSCMDVNEKQLFRREMKGCSYSKCVCSTCVI